MPDTGSPWALPYPAIGDAANVPEDLGDLAEKVADGLDTVNAKLQRSAILTLTSAFTPKTGWSLTEGSVFSVGSIWFYRVTVTRTGAAITVSSAGDVANVDVAQLVPAVNPAAQFPASSAGTGRVATGAILSTGVVQLAAVGGGGVSIATGDSISLGGVFAV